MADLGGPQIAQVSGENASISMGRSLEISVAFLIATVALVLLN